MAASFNAWVSGRSLPDIAGLKPAGGMDVSCECCVLSSRDIWSTTDRGVSECDLKTLAVKRPCPTRGLRAIKYFTRNRSRFWVLENLNCASAPTTGKA